MSEKGLLRLFIVITVVSLVIFVGLSVDSVRKVSANRTLPVTADVAAGKRIWQGKNCNSCHTILGIGGYFAPELTKVVERRDPQWLQRFIADPQGTKPGTTMPNLGVTAEEAGKVVAFFEWVAQIDTNQWPPQPLVKPAGSTAAGQTIFQQKTCPVCHRIGGTGGTVGPALDAVGDRYGADWLKTFISNPSAVRPGTIMPKIPLTDDQLNSLVDYLTTLKD